MVTSANPTSALCLTVSPPKSVTLKTYRSPTECTWVDCHSNAGVNTPTMAYGQSMTLGPFTCASSTAGIRCTLVSGDGFLIVSSATTARERRGRRQLGVEADRPFCGFLKQI